MKHRGAHEIQIFNNPYGTTAVRWGRPRLDTGWLGVDALVLGKAGGAAAFLAALATATQEASDTTPRQQSWPWRATSAVVRLRRPSAYLEAPGTTHAATARYCIQRRSSSAGTALTFHIPWNGAVELGVTPSWRGERLSADALRRCWSFPLTPSASVTPFR